MIIHPQGFPTFQEWADQMSFLVGEEAPQFLIYSPIVGDDWRDWAMCVVGSQDKLGQDSPDPYQFDSWREWAERFFITQDFSG